MTTKVFAYEWTGKPQMRIIMAAIIYGVFTVTALLQVVPMLSTDDNFLTTLSRYHYYPYFIGEKDEAHRG